MKFPNWVYRIFGKNQNTTSRLPDELNDEEVITKYVEAGAEFGDAVSYIHLGECPGFERMLNRWEKWEQEYARRGYRTIPIDDFVMHGGFKKPLASLRIKRTSHEEPILHAEQYREQFLGKPVLLKLENYGGRNFETQLVRLSIPDTDSP